MSVQKVQSLSQHLFKTLGKGFSESVYANALGLLFRENNIPYSQEVVIPVIFEGHTIGSVRADFVVEHDLVVELKAVARDLSYTDSNQLEMYMKLLGVNRGILVSFDQRPDREVVFVNVGC